MDEDVKQQAIQIENVRTRVSALEARMAIREQSALGVQQQLHELSLKIERLSSRVGFMAAGIGIITGGISSAIGTIIIKLAGL